MSPVANLLKKGSWALKAWKLMADHDPAETPDHLVTIRTIVVKNHS